MRTFQIVILGLFGFFIVAGVIAFATFRGSDSDRLEPVTIWGTLPAADFNALVQEIRSERDILLDVIYEEFSKEAFDRELTESLAASRGPDLILLPENLIIRYRDKVLPIPYESYPERDFKDNFIEEGELYLRSEGLLGVPFSVDPLVMYWNRTLFSNAAVASPPSYWDELLLLVEKLTDVKEGGSIIERSAVALGEFSNIPHAKELLATFMLQAGTPIVRETGIGFVPTLLERGDAPEIPAEAAVRFYTEFANPVKRVYSWNRALPNAEEMFLAGDLAMYFGFASELPALREKNPNLNFDVAPLPQIRGGVRKVTYGAMNAFAIMKTSPRSGSAFGVIQIMTDAPSLSLWSKRAGLPPPGRILLREKAPSAGEQVFFGSALIAGAFYDPDPPESESVFKMLIEDVTSGRRRIGDAVRAANESLRALLK